MAPLTRLALPKTSRAALIAALLAGAVLPARAQTVRASKAEVEAVFLYNFARFVTWPESAFADARAPLTICVLGTDPFGPLLDETVRGERLGEHPIAVTRIQRTEQATACHILYVGASLASEIEAIGAGTRASPVLTVSGVTGFARRGGIIEFLNDAGRVRLRINLRAAQSANLSVSSKLLRVADVVGTDGR